MSLREQVTRSFKKTVINEELNERLSRDISLLLDIHPFVLTNESIYKLAPYFQKSLVANYLVVSKDTFENPNDLILPFIAFHDTQLFTQLVEKANLPPKHFFSNLKAPLQRKTLVQRLVKDPQLLDQILGQVLTTIKLDIYYPQLSSFYVATLLEYLNEPQDATNIRIILGNLFQIARHDLHIDMKASILIVLSHISQRIDFTMDIYENFQSVLNHFLTTEESLEMCFFTLLSIFQSQKQVKRVSTQLVKNFSGYIQFADLLVKAANEFTSDDISESILDHLSSLIFMNPSCRQVLLQILQSNCFSEYQVQKVIQLIVDNSVDYFSKNHQKQSHFSVWLPDFFNLFRAKHESFFSKYVQERSSTSTLNEKKSIATLLKMTCQGRMRDSNLILKLNSIDEGTRFDAILELSKTLPGSGNQFEFDLESRLNDDSPLVVQKVLEINHLEDYMPNECLTMCCISIIKNSSMLSIRHLSVTKLIDILSKMSLESFEASRIALFGLLDMNCDLKSVSKIVHNGQLLFGFTGSEATDYIQALELKKFNSYDQRILFERLALSMKTIDSYKYIVQLFECGTFCTRNAATKLLTQYVLFKKSTVENMISMTTFIMTEMVARKTEFYPLLEAIIQTKLSIEGILWNSNSPYTIILRNIFNALCKIDACVESQAVLTLLISTHLLSNPLAFLVSFWIPRSTVNSLIMSLRLSEQIILAQNDVSNLCILPYLLPLLEDRDKSIRQLAISNLEALSSVLVASQTTHNPKDRIFISKLPVFLESLTARRTEFLLNKSAFRSFMTSYFSMTDLKSTNENSIFLYLINFVDNSPISIQSVLVDLMKDIEAPIKLISLMPTILLVLDLPHSTQQSKFLSSIVKNLNQTVSKAMNEAQIHSLTMKILSETTCSKIRIMFMENFPINFYMSIVKQKRQSALLLQLLELSFDRELSKSAKSLIKSIKFSGTIFKVGLKSTGYLAEESTNLSMKQLSLILELLMDVPILELTTCYFTILNNLLNKSEPGSEYAKQLLLTNLLVIVKNPVVESDLRVDILVQILRTSLNPSTQTLVLNVLSEIAQYSAHKVITNILPIFTFIGTMLKQDDEYTYHVISKTLLILLPNLTKQVDDVIDIFVNTVSHIPKHRRVKVFQLLVKGTTLPKILVKLIEKEDSAAAIAAQLALKYEVGEVMLAIDEISSIDTVKWINQLLANKKFACASNFKLVSGIMEKMFSLLEERTKQTDVYEVIGKLNGMLETEQFVEMCMKLMNHSHHTIRNQTLILFAEKTSLASKDSISMYAVMLPKLIELFGLSDNDESRQHTLLCLSVMIKVFARENLSRFTSLFQLAASVISQPDLNVNVRISCVSMVSLLMIAAGPQALPTLTSILPQVFDMLELNDDMQSLAAIGYICTLIESLPQFLSPYIKTILEKLFSDRIIKLNKNSKQVSQKVYDKSVAGFKLLELIPNRVLVPAMISFYAADKACESLIAYFDVFESIITKMPRSEITDHNQKLHSFFLNVLEYSLTSNNVLVEESIKATYKSYILKLNESLFKPHFMRMIEWGQGEKEACFYKTIGFFFDNLKSLFSPYFNYVLMKSIDSLDKDNMVLKKYILDSIYLWMLHKGEMDISDQISKILDPLSMQVYLIEDKSIEMSHQDILNHVVPCLIQICVHSAEPIWKRVNQHIHKYAQSQNAEIRMCGLSVLKGIYEKMGEEFLVLLPETIPFLAELMEDEDTRVEKMCHQVCGVIQQYLGEDISEYFNT